MSSVNAHIIAELKKQILLHAACKQQEKAIVLPAELNFLEDHLPLGVFPTEAVHEFVYTKAEDVAVTNGFISGLLSTCIPVKGIIIWISKKPTVFPAVLQGFHIEPSEVIFIHPANDKELLWVTEEALKCDGMRAVVAELNSLSFTNSRRLQLAVEKSKATGFVLTPSTKTTTNACVSRWRITSLPSEQHQGLPGVGFPTWNVELLKMRNGKPGQWKVEWAADHFNEINETTVSANIIELHQQTG